MNYPEDPNSWSIKQRIRSWIHVYGRAYLSGVFSTLLLALVIWLLAKPHPHRKVKDLEVEITEDIEQLFADEDYGEAPPPEFLYGLQVDLYDVEENRVNRGESLSTIMDRCGVSPSIVHRISQQKQFDFRKMKAGQPYTLFFSQDSVHRLDYFVYEEDMLGYIVVNLQEPITVSRQSREIIKEERCVNLKIHSSLWLTMNEAGLKPQMTDLLSDIYEWSIDFYRIQEGDEIRVWYEDASVEGVSLGEYVIRGAIFTHKGHPFYAIPFEQGGRRQYFDKDGSNLTKKAFLKAPLNYKRISSRFTNKRFHPVLKTYRAHHGVDYAAPTGTPVRTIGDGEVIATGYQPKGGGNYIKIKHDRTFTTVYMHLSKFAKGMKKGVRVKQGQTIGYVGATGLATGPHLDFRVYKDGKAIDPLKMPSPSKDPITEANRSLFNEARKRVEEKLLKLE